MRGTAAGQASTRTRASVLRPAADRAVDMLGVGRKLLLAQLEVADGVGSGRTGEEISRASVPVPAAQPVQALLFLLELREGELASASSWLSSARYLPQSARNSDHSCSRVSA